MPDFEPRQVVVVHEVVWQALLRLAEIGKMDLQQIPGGSDADGNLVMVPEGDMPSYAFMPRV